MKYDEQQLADMLKKAFAATEQEPARGVMHNNGRSCLLAVFSLGYCKGKGYFAVKEFLEATDDELLGLVTGWDTKFPEKIPPAWLPTFEIGQRLARRFVRPRS